MRFQKSLAIEYAKKNININCVSPGFIKTDMTEKINEDFKKILISKIPSGDLGTGEDVSNCVAFLLQIWPNILMEKQYMLMVECIWLDNSINNLLRIKHLRKEFMSEDIQKQK